MRVSVVIPTLNEARRIRGCLDNVQRIGGVHECIVVDGGSEDATVELARAHGTAVVMSAPRSRARQLNAGASRATGDALLFLHCDVALPAGAIDAVRATLAKPTVVAGAFRTWHVPERAVSGRFRAALHLADLRSRYSGLPYGDQAMFMTRQLFQRVGGFPDLPLMEDLALSRQLRRLGRICVARQSVRVSGRRFESAPLYQTLLVNVFPLLFYAGLPAAWLVRLYGDPR